MKEFGTNVAPMSASNKMQKLTMLNHVESLRTRGDTLLTLNDYRRSLDVPMRLFFASMIAAGVLTLNAKATESKGQNVYIATSEYAEYFTKEGDTTLINISKLKLARKDFEANVLSIVAEAMNAKEANKGAKNV